MAGWSVIAARAWAFHPRLAAAVCASAFVFGACVPALDRTGGIVCGPGDFCPSNFRCVSGRCCPSDAPAGTCPVFAADGGTDVAEDVPATCDPDAGAGTCGAGRECRVGVCCPVTAGIECPVGGVGSACTMARDCVNTTGSSVSCAMTVGMSPDMAVPGGYCTSACAPTANPDTCGPTGACVDYVLGVLGFCAARCPTLRRACRADGPYICLNHDIGGGRSSAQLCLPDCVAGATCVGTARCYTAAHLCHPPCGRSGDPACPAGTVCSAADGVCLDACPLGNCHAGYLCSAGVPRLCRAQL